MLHLMRMANEIRNRLSENSRAFLKRAAAELEASPRHAVVDLCAGLELLMKARLAHEHWSLVAERPGDDALSKITRGDFVSVRFEKAIDRIESVTQGPSLSKADKELLKSIALHRNKVVHFYHQDLDSRDPALVAKAAGEQCRAWLLVERLVAKDWRLAFEAEQTEWGALRAAFQKNSVFLKEKFDSLHMSITAMRSQGATIEACGACGFEATVVTAHPRRIFDLSCLVCASSSKTIRVSCPTCGLAFNEQPEPNLHCSECDRDLWGLMGLADNATVHCAACFLGLRSAHASLEGDTYVCVCCLEEETPIKCGSCGRQWIGAARERLAFGCQECVEQ